MSVNSRKYIRTDDLDPAKFACSPSGLTVLPRSFCAYCSDTAPPIPTNKDNYWLDTSVDPAVLYSGATGTWVAYPLSYLVSGDVVSCIGSNSIFRYCDSDDDEVLQWEETASGPPAPTFKDLPILNGPGGTPLACTGVAATDLAGFRYDGIIYSTYAGLAAAIVANEPSVTSATVSCVGGFLQVSVNDDSPLTEVFGYEDKDIPLSDGVGGPAIPCTGVEATDLALVDYNAVNYTTYASLAAAIVINEPTVTNATVSCVGGFISVQVNGDATNNEIVASVNSIAPIVGITVNSSQFFDDVDVSVSYTANGGCGSPGQISGLLEVKDGVGGTVIYSESVLAGNHNIDLVTPANTGGSGTGIVFTGGTIYTAPISDFEDLEFCYTATDACGNTTNCVVQDVVPRLVDIFNYTGTEQTVSSPPNWASSGTFKVWGAGGGGPWEPATPLAATAGAGGYSEGQYNLAALSTMRIVVGEGGVVRGTTPTYGNGGAGFASGSGDSLSGSSGGGLSGIFDNSFTHANAILIAGGGGGNGHGGANNYGIGGAGGGLIGEDASQAGTPNRGGEGGTQTAGGAGGQGVVAAAGSALQGGPGVGTNTTVHGPGGGGGGYYGGGGGNNVFSQIEGGGGGGSAYILGGATATNFTILSTGQFPANTGDEYYIAGVGVGGARREDGGDGLVVLIWNP